MGRAGGLPLSAPWQAEPFALAFGLSAVASREGACMPMIRSGPAESATVAAAAWTAGNRSPGRTAQGAAGTLLTIIVPYSEPSACG
jgi:hypothetical protein